jgi:hypothetical protein
MTLIMFSGQKMRLLRDERDKLIFDGAGRKAGIRI